MRIKNELIDVLGYDLISNEEVEEFDFIYHECNLANEWKEQANGRDECADKWENFVYEEDIQMLPPLRIKTERCKHFVVFDDTCPAKVIETKKSLEIITCANVTKDTGLNKVKKLAEGKFLNTETGEIFIGRKNERRTESGTNLNKSVKTLWKLIEENFEDNEGYFITLTYHGVMLDYYRAGKDFEKFKDKLKYHYELEFIKIIEPKASGSWHFHLLVKAKEGKELTVSEEKIDKLWSHGSTSVAPITNISGLQKYLASSGIIVNNEEDDDESTIFMLLEFEDKKKLREKQKRREFYRSGMRLYSCSSGIRKPKIHSMTKGEAIKMTESCEKQSAETIEIKTKSGHVLNIVSYEVYKKRKG